MKLKKLIAILLALLLVLSFAACDGGGGGANDNGGDTPAPVPPAPLCFTALGDNVKVGIKIYLDGNLDDVVIPQFEWSSDGENWKTVEIKTSEDSTPDPYEKVQRAPDIYIKTDNHITTLSSNSKMYIRAAGTNEYLSSSNKTSVFVTSFYFEGAGTVVASGNIMSLLDKTRTLTEISSAGCFYSLFEECNLLISAPELPATTLAANCYGWMFAKCTSLEDVPELPATTLAANCYEMMFYKCTSLKTAPELPATTLAEECYYSMFSRCSSLTTAPELPATTLAKECYGEMFYECTALTAAPELPATTLAEECYVRMFVGCTSLEDAPVLPATTLTNGCYGCMFAKCTSLKSITVHFENWSDEIDATINWVQEIGPTVGTFYYKGQLDVTDTKRGDSFIPVGWELVNLDDLVE